MAIADAVLASDDADARMELEQSLRDERLDPEVKSYVSRRLREAA